MGERFTASSTHTSFASARQDSAAAAQAGNLYASGRLRPPSGHLEDSENILQAAVREIHEETGITLDPAVMRLVLSIHQRNRGTTHTASASCSNRTGGTANPVNREPAKC